MKKSICLYFQVHQPNRLRLYRFFDIISANKGAFKLAFSISGSVLEQFDRYAPEVIDSFRKLADTGCVEFLSETYYHSLASLVSESEFKHQVMKWAASPQ